jgi:hypothetical protein
MRGVRNGAETSPHGGECIHVQRKLYLVDKASRSQLQPFTHCCSRRDRLLAMNTLFKHLRLIYGSYSRTKQTILLDDLQLPACWESLALNLIATEDEECVIGIDVSMAQSIKHRKFPQPEAG